MDEKGEWRFTRYTLAKLSKKCFWKKVSRKYLLRATKNFQNLEISDFFCWKYACKKCFYLEKDSKASTSAHPLKFQYWIPVLEYPCIFIDKMILSDCSSFNPLQDRPFNSFFNGLFFVFLLITLRIWLSQICDRCPFSELCQPISFFIFKLRRYEYFIITWKIGDLS